uniref:Uncharacterized protein n=1 Tax=Anguilla anguilla TaxID=7936 RepID=A0A0E9V3B1_ANGAN
MHDTDPLNCRTSSLFPPINYIHTSLMRSNKNMDSVGQKKTV